MIEQRVRYSIWCKDMPRFDSLEDVKAYCLKEAPERLKGELIEGLFCYDMYVYKGVAYRTKQEAQTQEAIDGRYLVKDTPIIDYTMECSNLCRSTLVVTINGIAYHDVELRSGGDVWCWTERVEHGPWAVEWTEGFPEEYKEATLEAINEEIPWGCCGGCI